MKLYKLDYDIFFENEEEAIDQIDHEYINLIELNFKIGDIKTLFRIINECCNKLKCSSPLYNTVVEEIFRSSHITFKNILGTNKNLTIKFVSLIRGFDRLDTKVIVKNFIIE